MLRLGKEYYLVTEWSEYPQTGAVFSDGKNLFKNRKDCDKYISEYWSDRYGEQGIKEAKDDLHGKYYYVNLDELGRGSTTTRRCFSVETLPIVDKVSIDDIGAVGLQRVSPFDEIVQLAYQWIDFMYNEGSVEFSDKSIAQYAEGVKRPDFKGICKDILDNFDNIGYKTQDKLKKYIKTGKGRVVESAIITAIAKFYNDANVELFI